MLIIIIEQYKFNAAFVNSIPIYVFMKRIVFMYSNIVRVMCNITNVYIYTQRRASCMRLRRRHTLATCIVVYTYIYIVWVSSRPYTLIIYHTYVCIVHVYT